MITTLVSSQEPLLRVLLLLELTRIDSEDLRTAIVEHLSGGMSLKTAAETNGIKQQNFNRALKRVNEVATVVEKIKQIDWAKL